MEKYSGDETEVVDQPPARGGRKRQLHQKDRGAGNEQGEADGAERSGRRGHRPGPSVNCGSGALAAINQV